MTTVPRLRSNFASNFSGPMGAVMKPLRCSMPRRCWVCAEPAMAMARSRAIWDLMAVDIVRRKILKSLVSQRRLLGLGGSRESAEGCFWTAVGESWLVSLTLLLSLLVPLVPLVMRLLDFLRDIGHEGSMFEEPGGGGRGEEFISPIRRRVRVSWALVGTPFRSVLGLISKAKPYPVRDLSILLYVQIILPVWNFAVQKVHCPFEDWIAKKSESDNKANTLDNHIA